MSTPPSIRVDALQVRVRVLRLERHHREGPAGIAPRHHLVRPRLGPIVVLARAHVQHAALDCQQQRMRSAQSIVLEQPARKRRGRSRGSANSRAACTRGALRAHAEHCVCARARTLPAQIPWDFCAAPPPPLPRDARCARAAIGALRRRRPRGGRVRRRRRAARASRTTRTTSLRQHARSSTSRDPSC